jgi:uncharacterized membrane protein YqjE
MAQGLTTDQKTSTEHMPRTEPQDRSLGELFTDLSHETAELIQQEVALAKAEMTQKASRLGKGAILLVSGGALAYAGLLGILTAIIVAIAQAGLPLWASALLVGGVIVFSGGILIGFGIAALKHTDPTPRETLETLKEDKEWITQQTK